MLDHAKRHCVAFGELGCRLPRLLGDAPISNVGQFRQIPHGLDNHACLVGFCECNLAAHGVVLPVDDRNMACFHLLCNTELCTFRNMRISKAQICWIRHSRRLTAEGQRAELEAVGCGQTFVADDRWQIWNEMIDQLRRGDVIKVRRLHLFVPERWRSNQNRYLWLWDCVHAIEDRGASWIEIDTGRKSTVPRERDDAIRDALEYIRGHANAPFRKTARENGAKSAGRKPKYTPEQIEAARDVWFDLNLSGHKLKEALRRGGHPPQSKLQRHPPNGLGPRRA